MSRTYRVDTNHLSAAINPVSRVRERFYPQQKLGIRFRTCIPVLCEIEVGIQDSSKVESYRRQLDQVIRKVKLIPLEPPMAQEDGAVYRELPSKGRALAQVDIILAAMVRHLKWTLLTSARDFEALPDIQTENGLA